MSLLPFCSRFLYGGEELAMTLPITPWNFANVVVGGDIEADSGMRAAFVVCRNELITFVLRFYEAEWPNVQAFIDFAQSGEEIVWYPDDTTESGIVCNLDSPGMGENYAAQPDPEYGRVLNLAITLVRPNCMPWDLPDFIDREEAAEPEPLPPGWVIHIFDEAFSDNLDVLSGEGDAYVLMVGGGGSGGSVDGFSVGGGGGGGGEVIVMPDPLHTLDYLHLLPGNYHIVRGPGGNAPHADHTIAGGVFGAVTGVSGDDTTFAGFTARGGGGGGGANVTIQRRGKDGGSGGGGASAGDPSPSPGAYDGGTSTAVDGYGEDGGDGLNNGSAAGAGGGGASAPGAAGLGGAGLLFDISNIDEISVEYGHGGDARAGGPGRFAGANTGHGGEGGGQALMSDGADGADGIVIVKYRMETGIVAIGGRRTEYPE